MYKDVVPLAYNDNTKKYINITGYLETETRDEKDQRQFNYTFQKNIRPCTRTDFEKVDLGYSFDSITTNGINYLNCVNDWSNVTILITQDTFL